MLVMRSLFVSAYATGGSCSKTNGLCRIFRYLLVLIKLEMILDWCFFLPFLALDYFCFFAGGRGFLQTVVVPVFVTGSTY